VSGFHSPLASFLYLSKERPNVVNCVSLSVRGFRKRGLCLYGFRFRNAAERFFRGFGVINPCARRLFRRRLRAALKDECRADAQEFAGHRDRFGDVAEDAACTPIAE